MKFEKIFVAVSLVTVSFITLAVSLAQAMSPQDSSSLLRGSFELLPGQAQECYNGISINPVQQSQTAEIRVAYGNEIPDPYADEGKISRKAFSHWTDFDGIGNCRKQNDGRLRWHSSSAKTCVVRDTPEEFIATDRDIYAPWMAGRPKYFEIKFVRTARSNVFELSMTNAGAGPTCLYKQTQL